MWRLRRVRTPHAGDEAERGADEAAAGQEGARGSGSGGSGAVLTARELVLGKNVFTEMTAGKQEAFWMEAQHAGAADEGEEEGAEAPGDVGEDDMPPLEGVGEARVVTVQMLTFSDEDLDMEKDASPVDKDVQVSLYRCRAVEASEQGGGRGKLPAGAGGSGSRSRDDFLGEADGDGLDEVLSDIDDASVQLMDRTMLLCGGATLLLGRDRWQARAAAAAAAGSDGAGDGDGATGTNEDKDLYLVILRHLGGQAPRDADKVEDDDDDDDDDDDANDGAAWDLRLSSQRIQICHAAEELPVGVQVHGSAGKDEFTYYQFTLDDPTKLLTIRVWPSENDDGDPIGDPDLYVTNKCGGLVRVNKDNCTWKSTNTGADRVDVHPDDPRAALGNVFMIGVLGYHERNDFVLQATVHTPPRIHDLILGGPPITLDMPLPNSPQEGANLYLRLPVSSTTKGKYVMNITVLDNRGNSVFGRAAPELQQKEAAAIQRGELPMSQGYGRGVYATDFIQDGLDENTQLCWPVLPTVYMSSTCMYPCAADCTWRASSLAGRVRIIFECDEWKFTSGLCYLNVYSQDMVERQRRAKQAERDLMSTHLAAAALDQEQVAEIARLRASRQAESKFSSSAAAETSNARSAASASAADGAALPQPPGASADARYQHKYPGTRVRIDVMEFSAVHGLSPIMQARYHAFTALFSSDAGILSQKDRQELGCTQSSFTYGEVDFLAFTELLRSAGAKAGDIFCDLGSGAGKAIAAAAMSGIGFARCLGIEYLPSLLESSQQTMAQLQSKVQEELARLDTDAGVGAANTDGAAEDGDSGVVAPFSLVQGDFTEVDWSASNVIYTSSICFTEELMRSISKLARKLRPGTIFMTLKPLHRYKGYFVLVESTWAKMTWGRCSVLIYKRTGRGVDDEDEVQSASSNESDSGDDPLGLENPAEGAGAADGVADDGNDFADGDGDGDSDGEGVGDA